MKTKAQEILFVTYEFPYGGAETFIETEISYLSAGYVKVWILPSRAVWSRKWLKSVQNTKRVIPDNCEVVTPIFNITQSLGMFLRYFTDVATEINVKLFTNTINLRLLRETIRETVKTAIFLTSTTKFVNSLGSRVVAYSYWKSPAAVALTKFKQKKKLFAVVTRCHREDLYNESLGYPSRPYDNYLNKYCDFVMPISQHGIEYLLNKSFDKKRLCLSRLGVQLSKNRSITSPSRILNIVSCSNIIPVKRVDLLALALVKLKIPFCWTHFGDGKEKSKIERIVKQFPDHGEAVFCGRISNLDVLEFYQKSPVDLFVNVSESEGAPVSIMEALGAGIPCVATNVGGVSELVDDSVGRLIEVSISDEGLAQVIEREALDKGGLLLKRRNALLRARALCDADVNYTSFMKFLRDL